MPNLLNRDPHFATFQVGDWSYGNPYVMAFDDKGLKIGSFCSIANNVAILLRADHRTDWITTYPFMALWPEAATFSGHPAKKGDIVIGNDVWIGHGAIILSGVRIGNGAVIGAGSVVAKDIPAYAIAAGNPAKIIRFRFSPAQIAALEEIAWWHWPREKITDALPLLLSPEIDRFISQHIPPKRSDATTRPSP